MTTFVLLAGENVGAVPMALAMRRRYGAVIDGILCSCGVALFARGQVEGAYMHDDGTEVRERTLVRAGVLLASEIPALRVAIAQVAVQFHQEAIGLVLHSPDTAAIVRRIERPDQRAA